MGLSLHGFGPPDPLPHTLLVFSLSPSLAAEIPPFPPLALTLEFSAELEEEEEEGERCGKLPTREEGGIRQIYSF